MGNATALVVSLALSLAACPPAAHLARPTSAHHSGAILLVADDGRISIGVRHTWEGGRERCYEARGVCTVQEDPPGVSCQSIEEVECECSRCDPAQPAPPRPVETGPEPRRNI